MTGRVTLVAARAIGSRTGLFAARRRHQRRSSGYGMQRQLCSGSLSFRKLINGSLCYEKTRANVYAMLDRGFHADLLGLRAYVILKFELRWQVVGAESVACNVFCSWTVLVLALNTESGCCEALPPSISALPYDVCIEHRTVFLSNKSLDCIAP